jgi:RHH-type proline utilization regulon transcriptional repressor/proline dehydrogenase/delta 1-pyrroline-5-carboxylate dehydrogenase
MPDLGTGPSLAIGAGGGAGLLDVSYTPDEMAVLHPLLERASLAPEREARVDGQASRLIGAIRARGGLGGLEEVLREYSLSTREGLALMVLAEALLRVPDARTADALIEDKLGSADFGRSRDWSGTVLVNASAWALGMSVRVIQPGETPEGVLAHTVKRLGVPTVRAATRQAMRVMGGHFVLGQTIGEALSRAGSRAGRAWRYSFDMLGEGARTADDADRYARSYADAIEAIGRAGGNRTLPDRPGISVKLSALHPRYEAVSQARVMAELVPRVATLARAARAHELNFTVDAEEQDRLQLSLDVIEAVLSDPGLAGWDGFGLAVQAYGKRSLAVVEAVAGLAERLGRRLMVRLVKGAYWDTEVKRAQERGLDGYPVFTRKPATDLAYLACAERMLALRPLLYPQFATHNALTVASIIERAGGTDGGGSGGGGTEGYEFQRLHGMGDALYGALLREHPGVAVRTYAPVGGHADLLAYLVRRLLENGANTSFVAQAADPAVPVEHLLQRPAAAILAAPAEEALPLPAALFADRRNSVGVEFGDRAALQGLLDEVAAGRGQGPVEAGETRAGAWCAVLNPATGAVVGQVAEDVEAVTTAMQAAHRAQPAWDAAGPEPRAAALERTAALVETERGRLLSLLVDEGGKTLDDALSELRETVDFLRYYAVQARALFRPQDLPGPTGESNTLTRHGRGVWVCISPWNFPLAIFTGQVAAALAAGNAVVAKPAPQTPLVAAEAVRLLHRAGVPADVLHLAPGGGEVGAALVAHPLVAGVAFTGSTAISRAINRRLAAKAGPIVPLIAETGGINAMVVDATALPEQVADDAVTSAFRSAGQRCSALRLICVQADVADKIAAMIAGAAAELRLGDPADPATHIGPVIDVDAKARLDRHIARMTASARTLHAGQAPPGGYVAPHLFEIERVEDLGEEVFGPVLHLVRWRADRLEALLDALAATGYGLTLGVQSRVDGFVARVLARVPAGNAYVNRSMIGAVVGSQPFGGQGLSGTGPKAGGPDYLRRFAVERVVTINTAAAGGNAALLTAGR